MGDDHPLHPEEAALIEGVVPRRAQTFAAGRAAARAALAAAGCTVPEPILWSSRAPAPPQGWRLSISHTDSFAAAIACRADRFAGVGLDIEDARRIEPGMRRFIVRPEDTFPPDPSQGLVGAAFSLREAMFKALETADQRRLQRIDLAWDGQRFEATLQPALPVSLQHVGVEADGHVISVCVRHPR